MSGHYFSRAMDAANGRELCRLREAFNLQGGETCGANTKNCGANTKNCGANTKNCGANTKNCGGRST